MLAWQGRFTVLEDRRKDRVLLEAEDPAEAAAFLAGWLRQHRA
ncbi:hypothetical protein [Kitasatospora sp. NPDC058190]